MKMTRLLLVLVTLVFTVRASAQVPGFSFTCSRDTTIQDCGAQVCFNLKARVPDVRSTSSYTVNPVSSTGGCFAPVVAPNDPAGTPTSITVDDRYSSKINLPFTFTFYGINYSSLVASGNGYLSFDPNNNLAGTFSHYGIIQSGTGLGANTGTPQDLPSSRYDPSVIMGVYHDLDPGVSASPTKKIQYQVYGVAPYRRFVLSFYKIPLYQTTGSTCNQSFENTSQITLYESTNIIEVSVYSQQICTAWNQGRAMIGIQDHNGGAGIMPPGRRASDAPWGSANMNETWRFVPASGSTSLLKRVEVLNSANVVLATGTRGTAVNGVVPVTFPNLCVGGGITRLVVRAAYQKYGAPTQEIYTYDTVRVIAGFNATATPTHATCATPGSIKVDIPAGEGVPPFSYSINNGAYGSSNTFTGLNPGTYSVIARDANCADTMTVTVLPPAGLSGTTATVPSGCNPSGSITVTPTSGTAPYTYALDGSPTFQSSNIFTAVAAGAHTVTIKDAQGCTGTVNVTVGTRAALGGSGTAQPSGCTPSGSVTITPAGGTAPFSFSINGGSTWQSAGQFNLLGAGTYNVRIKDSTGCTFDVNGVIVPGTTLTASAVTTNSNCTPSGTITVSVTPPGLGTPPYTYQLGTTGTPQNGNTFGPLAAGTYTVIVRDATGCQVSVTATIDSNPPVTLNAISTPSGCNPPSGTITATANGVAPYTFKLDGVRTQASGLFTGVTSGQHTVEVTDAGGCVATFDIVVGATPAVDASATSTPSGCTPADGSITVSATGGTGTFTYKLLPNTTQPGNTFTGLAAGNYTVVVEDAVGCTDTVAVSVGATPLPAGTASTTLSGCTPSGTITINMNQGTGPYSYRLGTAGTPQASNTFNGQAAGTYTITVTDAKGCTVDIQATVGQHPALTAIGNTTPSGCTPPSGSITITVPAGAGLAPFTYDLDALGPVASNSFTGVTAGAHQVVVRDAAGCSFPVDVVVGAPAPLTAAAATTPSGCAPSGTITVTVTPGIGQAPFQYRLGGAGTPQASNVFNNIGAGTYTVTVLDAAGCTVDVTAVVDPAQPLLATVRTHSPSCDAAANGSAVLLPQNGIAPFQFRINGGAWQASDSFPNLAAGIYNLQFQDASGCISPQFPATVAAGAPITAVATQNNVACFGGSNGSATLTLSGNATAPFLFSTDNFSTSQAGNTITGLPAGAATIWFRDAQGCSNSIQVTITQPAALSAGTTQLVQPKCFGAANGTVTLSASGGTAPYQYSFNGSAFGPAAQFTSAAGTFNGAIRDANNCSVTVNGIVLTEPARLVIDSVVSEPATCVADGRLRVFASGGTTPFQYQLNTGSYGASNSFTTAAGTYSVSVQDANNCAASRPGNVVTQISNLQYVSPGPDTICQGSKTTLAPVTNATGFVWTGPAIVPNNTQQSSIDVRPVRDTFYILNYTLGSCSGRDSIPVTVRPAPVPDAGTATEICFGQDGQLNAATGFSAYHWAPSTYLTDANIRNPRVIRPNASITYQLHVVDANGCASLVPDTVTQLVTPPIIVRFSPPDTVAYIGDTLRIIASAAANHFEWFTSMGTTPVNIVNPNVPNALLLVEKTETFRIRAWTDQGCSGEGFFYLRAYRGPEIYVPDAFTPNRDGKNDLLRPVCVGLQTLNYFRVFNRWGQLMYEYKGERRGPEVYNLRQSNIGWDGRQNGKELVTGTYVWVAEGVTKEGKRVSRKGVVTLIQ
ncbi:hypothetical protein EPD60_10215 [Flaviaesturariibacter flavus]|uniref:T9SS type B sorting domain-containing protein n=1 Tax=Flaviaesturariibacter flavus TaxID=2502780 RepID=A0A4R1BBH4_9BACT|nr:gliding motility-associated C-terminal domain-containing protein [Flaviaesturariibacter flavus]TCJ14361.1 hypothetical protein EPD60_10215 [Flaviaesturariibacter flavus]